MSGPSIWGFYQSWSGFGVTQEWDLGSTVCAFAFLRLSNSCCHSQSWRCSALSIPMLERSLSGSNRLGREESIIRASKRAPDCGELCRWSVCCLVQMQGAQSCAHSRPVPTHAWPHTCGMSPCPLRWGRHRQPALSSSWDTALLVGAALSF